MDNGRRIDITKDNFLIGKERKKVDYCIGGDSSVSRIHAMIRIIQGGFYIEDQDSTNYTFVNNNQIPAYKAVYIQDGSIFVSLTLNSSFTKIRLVYDNLIKRRKLCW